jgi:hypothetical protein
MMNLLKVMQSARKEDLHLLQMIYQANKGAAPPGQNPMKDMLNTAKAYSEMQKIFGGNNNSNEQQPQNEDMALLTTVGDIAKAVINRPKGDVVKSLPNPRISQPTQEQYQPEIQPQQAPNQIRSDSEISGAMANMTPERVNEILLTSLQKMPDDKREKVFEVFEKRTGLSFYDPSMVEEQDGDEQEEQEQHQTPRRSRIPQDPHKV